MKYLLDLFLSMFGVCRHPYDRLTRPVTLPDETTGIPMTYQVCTGCTRRLYINNDDLTYMSERDVKKAGGYSRGYFDLGERSIV